MKIFIGHDSTLEWNTIVCEKSIRKYLPDADITRIDIKAMRELGYDRDEDGSTEFTYTRFLVPMLSGYQGLSLFCDSDFVWQGDPTEIASYSQEYNAVSVVQHRKYEASEMKMDGRPNSTYDRKWWSSLMLFNCSHPHCKRLTVEEVNQASPAYLHRLWWAEEKVGKLPGKYNHLVGYDSPGEEVFAYHFTDGTPIHKGQRFGPCVEKYLEHL